MTALLDVRSLHAGYAGRAVVRDLDLHVDAGEVVVLLGPNGAGKTTTLLTLAGDLAKLSGTVAIDGSETTASLSQRARTGMAFVTEERSVFMRLSVADNLRIGRADRELALDLFPELRPLLRRRAGLLSGGEQQMLTLARALGRRPRLLLADELSLGLAPLVVERLLDAVRDAAQEAGAARASLRAPTPRSSPTRTFRSRGAPTWTSTPASPTARKPSRPCWPRSAETMGAPAIHVAVVGSGPAGFYTAGRLLQAAGVEISVDLFERLPTPWGLVRFGVAPEHPRIKTVSRVFEKTAAHPRFRFLGNVDVGVHVTRAELTALYDAVVYATGAADDRPLGIPGEALRRSTSSSTPRSWNARCRCPIRQPARA